MVGGLFERLIRSTKRCLKKTLKLFKLNFEEMTTILAEVVAVLNSRPLTYLHPDNTEILTPYHLYTCNRVLDPPTPEFLILGKFLQKGQEKEFRNSII